MGEGAARWLRRAAATLAVLALGSCDLGAKQDVADRVTHSREIGGSARLVDLTLAVQPQNLPSNAPNAGVPSGGVYAASTGALDARHGISVLFAPAQVAARIAALTGDAADTTAPLAFATRHSVTVRRPARDVVAARAWYRLDLEDAREVTKPNARDLLGERNGSDLAVLNPTFMVDLLSGVLAGSVTQRGDTVSGRLSIDKANREDDLDDDAIEARRQAFRLFAVTDDVQDFSLTLGDDGEIRALRVGMVMKPNKQTRIELNWAMKVSDATATLTRPGQDEQVRISSFNQVRGALVGWFVAP